MAVVLLVFALIYAAGIVLSRFRLAGWRAWSDRANPLMGLGGIAVALILLTLWADPFAMSARSQVERLHAGYIAADKFDLGTLQYDMSEVGHRALQALSDNSGKADRKSVEEQITLVRGIKNRWEWANRKKLPVGQDFEELMASIRVLPAGELIAPDFFEDVARTVRGFFSDCAKDDGQCAILVSDTIPGGSKEYLLITLFRETRLAIYVHHNNDGKSWQQYANEGIWGESAKDAWLALMAGKFEPEIPRHRNLRIGDETIQLYYLH